MNHPSTVWNFGPLTIKRSKIHKKKVEFEEVTPTPEPKGKMCDREETLNLGIVEN